MLQCAPVLQRPDRAGQSAPAGPRRSHGDRPVGDRSTKGSGGPKGAHSRRPSEFSGWQLVKRHCGEIGSQPCEMISRHRIPRVAHRLSGVGRRDRLDSRQAKTVPVDGLAAVVVSRMCGQAGQNTFASLSGITLRSLRAERISAWERGYSVGRLPSGNFLQARQQGRKEVGAWDISARAKGSRRVCDMDPGSFVPPRMLRRLELLLFTAAWSIGNFGLALGEIYMPRGNKAAEDEQAS